MRHTGEPVYGRLLQRPVYQQGIVVLILSAALIPQDLDTYGTRMRMR